MNLSTFLDAVRSIRFSSVESYDDFSTSNGAASAAVLIGCGDWKSSKAIPSAPLMLQNKGAKQRFGKAFSSVTKMLMDPLDGYLESWDMWPSEPVNLQEFVDSLRLVGEDGSPDSIFGILVLMARAARVPAEEWPAEWIEAVDDWERTGTAEDPFRSWCSLESALAHSMLSASDSHGPSAYTEAWQQGLMFAVNSLRERCEPLLMPVPPKDAYHIRAYAAVEQDEQMYKDWLQQAPVIQLSLPVAGLQGRYRLVDTLVIEEGRLTGAAKNFYRNDIVNSPLKAGFTLSLVYLPLSTESKPDITITVDPRRRVSLLELWEKLESAETAAWQRRGEIRSSDHIRDVAGVASKFNEPWFINPDQTLIGSPRKIAGVFAGRLSWKEVQNLVLQECNPIKNIRVVTENGSKPVPLLSLAAEQHRGASTVSNTSEKTFLLVSWPREREEGGIFLPAALPQAPTVRQLLATLTNPGRKRGAIEMSDLIAESSFDQIKLTGGFAIVSDWGVFVLDDWSKEKLDPLELRSTFENAANLNARLRAHLENELPEITKLLTKVLNTRRSSRNRDSLLKRLTILSLEVAQLRAFSAVPPANSNARILKEAMDHRWSLERRLGALEVEIKAIDGSLRSLIEVRSASINRFIAVYGFALFLASGLAGPLAKMGYHSWAAAHPVGDPPGLWVLVSFVFAALVLSGLLSFWLRQTDSLRRQPTPSSDLQVADKPEGSSL